MPLTSSVPKLNAWLESSVARRSLTAGQQARIAEQREDRVKELQTQLHQGVTDLITSDGWRTWLSFMARFRQYSLRNQLLILAQNPDATQVAGYRAWQAAGRQVRRGEKAISVLGPLAKKLVDNDGNPVLDDAGQPRVGIYGYKPVPVFDISQTEGPPIPAAPDQTPGIVAGAAPEGMWNDLVDYIAAHGFTVATTPSLGGPEGVTKFLSSEVLIVDGFPPAHAATVLAHEAGHVVMHRPDQSSLQLSCRGIVEVEAESFAHIVSADYGLDASASSFGYLAGWATSAAQQRRCAPEDVILESAERVRRAVIGFLDRRDPEVASIGAAEVGYAREMRRAIDGARDDPPPGLREGHTRASVASATRSTGLPVDRAEKRPSPSF